MPRTLFLTRPILWLATLLVLLGNLAHGQTTVSSIAANPNPFNLDRADSTQITVTATAGLSNLAVRIFADDQITVVRNAFALTETAVAGTYTASWSGTNNGGNYVPTGTYKIRVFNLSTTTDVGPYVPLQVTHFVDTLTYSPSPFTPDGTAEVTFTVTGEPNATDLEIYYYESGERRFPLVETPAGSGTYLASSTLMMGTTIPAHANRTLYVRTTDKQRYGRNTATMSIQTFSNLTRNKDTYFPSKGDVATFTATGVTGQRPKLILTRDSERMTGTYYPRQWTTAASAEGLPSGSWIYVAGDDTDAVGRWVESAKVNADGSLGAFSRINQMPDSRQGGALVYHNRWLYYTGGYKSGEQTTIYRAPVNNDGSLGDWVTDATAMPMAMYRHAALAADGFLYVAGDWSAGRNVHVAPINADGSLGAFVATSQFLVGRSMFNLFKANGYLYAVGGYSAEASVERAAVNGDGTLGNWEAVGSLLVGRYGASGAMCNGQLVIAGGYNSSIGYLSTVETAKLNGDGTLGAWTDAGAMGVNRYTGASVEAGDRVYFIAGYSSGIGEIRGVEYSSISNLGALGNTPPRFTDYGEFNLAESPSGTYTATYNFKDEAGNDIPRASYTAYLYQQDSDYYYQRSVGFTVDFGVTSIEATPNPFVPNGVAAVTITAISDPGQRNVRYNVASIEKLLTETSPGVYTATETFVRNGAIVTPATYTIYFRNELDGYNDVTGSIVVKHTGSLGESPADVIPSKGQTANFTIAGEPGQQLQVRVSRDGNYAAGLSYSRAYISNAAVRVADRIYVSGGSGTTNAEYTPEWTKIAGDKSLRQWLPQNRTAAAHNYAALAANSTTIYAVGGYSSNTKVVEFARFNADGSIGTWQTATPLPEERGIAPAIATDTFLYQFGGYFNGGKNQIFRAPINGDGSLGAWENIGTIPAAIYGHNIVKVGTRLYLAGGYASGYRTQTYYCDIQGDGSLTAWTAGTAMNQARYIFGLAEAQGYLFAVSGEGATDEYSIERAQILGDGTLGAWELLAQKSPQPSRIAVVGGGNGRLYLMGGSSHTRAVFFADVAADGTMTDFTTAPFATLPLVENPAGTYTVSWNGLDSNGQGTGAGDYVGNLYSATSGLPFTSRTVGFRLLDSIDTFEMIPQTFVPTGLNTALFRATGSAGQVGLYAVWDRNIYLSEVSPGTYEATFPFIRTNGYIESEYTNSQVTLYDAAGNNTGLNTKITIRNVRSYTTTPSTFSPTLDGNTRSEFSLAGEEGQNLRVRLFEGNERETGLLTARRFVGAATFTYNNRIYVIGGEISGTKSQTGEVIDLNADGSFQRPRVLRPMSFGKAYASAAAYNGWVYSVGGYTNRSSAVVERAPILPDGRLGEWIVAPSLNTERYVVACTAANGWLYTLGGYHTNLGAQNSIERAAIAADGSLGPWEVMAQTLPDRRYGLVSTVRGGYLYIFGGYPNQQTVYRSPISGDGTLGGWERLTDLVYSRYQHALAISGDRVYILGGEDGTAAQNVETAQFQADGTLSAWTALGGFPNRVYYSGAGAVNGNLYVLGGGNGSSTYARSIWRATINGDGTVGTWSAPTLPEVPLVANGTDYRYSWNGLDSAGNLVGQGTYTWYVYNADSGRYYGSSRSVTVVPSVQSVAIDTPELIVDGTNVANLTVQASPGIEGMFVNFVSAGYNSGNYTGGTVYLNETEPGTYVGKYSGIVQSSGSFALPDGTYTAYVYDQASRQMNNSQTLVVKGIATVDVAAEFTPGGGSTLPITLTGAEGLDPLVVIENVATGFTVRELPALETTGTYVAQWDGRDGNGNFTGPNTYRIRAYNDTTPRLRYNPTKNFTVRQAVFNLEVAPNPFTPGGGATATITVLADAGQTGLTAEITHPSGPVKTGIALTEQGSAGTFSGTWDGTANGGSIMPDGVAIVNIRNGLGQLFPISGSVTISTITRFDITPNPFTPLADSQITFRVDMLAGQSLEARVGVVKNVDLSDAGTPGQYTGTWNGRLASNDFAPAGQYNVTLADKSSGRVFSEARVLTINVVDLTPPRATIAWTAPAPPLGIGSRTFTLQASEVLKETPTFKLTPFAGAEITATFGASTNGGRNWPGTVVIPADVVSGTATFTWSGKDNSNNVGTAFTGSNTVTVDAVGPTISVNVTPSSSASFGLGVKTVTVSLNEQASTAPTVTFTPPQGGSVVVPVTGGPQTWIGSLNVIAGMGNGAATFAVSATDRVGNVGSTITSGAEWTIDLVAPGAPSTLVATAQASGRIGLTWIGAPGQPYNYQLWRVAGSGDPLTGTQIQSSLFSNSYTDTPPSQGLWSYAVTAADQAGNVGTKSNVAQATSDNAAPNAPVTLQANLAGDQVQLSWTAPAGEVPASYNVYYRGGSTAITATNQASRVRSAVVALNATVTAQPVGAQHYAVTALDAVGNESAVSNSVPVQYESPLPATTSLAIAYDSTKGATLSWAGVATAVGYNVYRDGSKLNAAPVAATMYLDADAPPTSNAVYAIRAVTASGAPGNAFQGTHRPAVIAVADPALTVEPNLLLPFPVTVTNPGANQIATTTLRLDFLDANGVSLQNDTKPFAQSLASAGSASLQLIEGIATYPAKIRSTVDITSGEAGVTVTAVREQALTIRPGGVRVEVFAEPLVRGVAAQVRLRFTNPSSIPIDLVTAVNADPSPDVVAEITTTDGTVLASAFLNQRGNGVFSTPGYAKAILQPGETFLTDAIAPVVPLDAPQTVLVRGRALHTYYSYGTANQIVGPALESAGIATQPTETNYRGIVASDSPLYGLGSTVTLTGQALSNTNNNPVPNVPLRIGIDVRGFRRFFTVTTDGAGNFTYPFTPFSNEFGKYTGWAVHPTVTDRPAQSQWNIAGVMLPSPISLRMAKNSSLNFTLTATSRSELPLTGLALTWLPDAGSDAVGMTFNLGSTSLAAGGYASAQVTVTAPIDAPSGAFGTIRMTTAEGLIATAEVNLELRPAQPSIRSTPSYIQAQLATAGSFATQIEIENVGFDDLKNARLGTPTAPWIQYTVDPDLGNIPPGGKKVIGVVLQPGGTLEPGNYTEQISLLSDNSATITYNVFATLTSSNKGNVLFHVEDILTPTLGGATVELGSVYTSALFYTGSTGADGNWLVSDVPTGDYNYRVSASGHTTVAGRVTVKSDTTEYVRALLQNSFVTVAWEVVPVPLEDRYEVTLKTTFETNVPAPVLIADPPSLVHPMTRPGVSYATFKVTNRGLIAGNDFRINPQTSSPGMRIEVLVDVVDTILPMQTLEIPYRVILDATATPNTKGLDYAQRPGFPSYDMLGMPMEEFAKAQKTDIPINPADCGLSGQLLAILNYLCRLESIATGVDHSVKPEVAAAAAGIGGALDPASVVCASTGCSDCCVALAGCAIPAPGSLGTPSCLFNIAKCLASFFPSLGGGGIGISGGSGGGGGGGGGGGYGGAGFSPCAPTGGKSITTEGGAN